MGARMARIWLLTIGLLTAAGARAELFVDIGVQRSDVQEVIVGTESVTSSDTGASLGIGFRRAVGDRGRIGFRAGLHEVGADTLVTLRAFDYSYDFSPRISATAFAGVARLDLPTAAYGYYLGGGVRLNDLWPSWDLGIELRHGDELARDNLLPSDPRPGFANFYDVTLFSVYLSRRF